MEKSPDFFSLLYRLLYIVHPLRANYNTKIKIYAESRQATAKNADITKKSTCSASAFLAGVVRIELTTRGFGDRCSTS